MVSKKNAAIMLLSAAGLAAFIGYLSIPKPKVPVMHNQSQHQITQELPDYCSPNNAELLNNVTAQILEDSGSLESIVGETAGRLGNESGFKEAYKILRETFYGHVRQEIEKCNPSVMPSENEMFASARNHVKSQGPYQYASNKLPLLVSLMLNSEIREKIQPIIRDIFAGKYPLADRYATRLFGHDVTNIKSKYKQLMPSP